MRRDRFHGELDEEMAFHRREAERAHIDSGMTTEAASAAAHRQLGNAARLREQSHSQIAFRFETVAQDLRFTLRQLVRNPAFAATAVFILALGIGASLAIFAFVDAALLEPLPYAQPNRLVSVNESSPTSPLWPLSYPDFLDWQRMNKSFSSLEVYGFSGLLLRSATGAEPVYAGRASGGFFRTLGVRPALGRDFNPGEDRPGGPNVVMLTYGAWVHRFGARPDIVGQSADLDGQLWTIIGVLPRGFSFAPVGIAEFWIPINSLSPHEQQRGFYNFFGIARLRDGVSLVSAQAEMNGIAARLKNDYTASLRPERANVVPLTELVIGDIRPILLTLFAGSALLLLIACVNVASLILVRSERRRREVAVRGALGATPARLIRQFLTEGLVLAALGSTCGLLIAAALMRALLRLVPADMAARMPFVASAGLNAHAAWFAMGVVFFVSLLLAATPALRLSFQHVREGLADGGRGSAGLLWRRLGSHMVVVELAIAVVLLSGAGLLGRSLYRLLHVPLGFEPAHLATVQVTARGSDYPDGPRLDALYREIANRAAALPGAQSAATTSMLPAQCECASDGIRVVGRPDIGELNDVVERHISPGYMHTIGATLARGRDFAESDNANGPNVAVINQALAHALFANADPLGQRISDNERGRYSEWQIVGVVNNVHEGPLDSPDSPAEYFPLAQSSDHSFHLAVRTSQDPAALLPILVAALHQIDPNLGVSDEATMTARIGATQSALLHRFSAWLVGGFATLALVLGVVGLYGVVAYSVSQRTREIGVRMALGAQRGTVYRLVLRQAAWLAASGIGIGIACATASSLLIRKLLFGVKVWDVPTLAAVTLLLACASLAAGFLPARRAAKVNPVDALRAE